MQKLTAMMRRFTGIVQKSLRSGSIVELDGLGVFSLNYEHGGFNFVANTLPRVFIAYAIEDLKHVRRLSADLRANGCIPWVDREMLLPGQNWGKSIEDAIEVADFFIACLSSNSVSKRGQFQLELRAGLHCAAKIPLEKVFLIPVRLDDCKVPARLRRELQYVDLFPDWQDGMRRILDTITD